MDYLCDEVVPFIDHRYPSSAQRGVAGHSSGGYGAMVTSMLRPDVFGAFASHAGDALFEHCYLRDFALVARQLRDGFEGSYEVFFERLAEAEHFDFSRFGAALSIYAMAAAYSPGALPFDVATGALTDEVWQQWLRWDPVRMAAQHADALRSMRRIYLDAGRRDEYFLDLGAQAFSAELARLGIDHTLELFDGGHGGIAYRYPAAVRELVRALS
jgi:S-formylglutathione hydrolase FrmB